MVHHGEAHRFEQANKRSLQLRTPTPLLRPYPHSDPAELPPEEHVLPPESDTSANSSSRTSANSVDYADATTRHLRAGRTTLRPQMLPLQAPGPPRQRLRPVHPDPQHVTLRQTGLASGSHGLGR